MRKLAFVIWLPLWVFGATLADAAEATSAVSRVTSALRFESSNSELERAFNWAKAQALSYAHGGGGPVGPWYEAALPSRSAFCMRDVAHQAVGAAALGLDAANLNMLGRFATAVSPARDWAGYWEIDVTGKPSPADYVNDHDFWFNLPANFDVLDAVVRMWAWTGDETYLSDPRFTAFFEATSGPYVKTWALEPERILSRPRIMNVDHTTHHVFEQRGLPSYNESAGNFNVGVDLLAVEYRAFMDLAFLAERRHDLPLQQKYLRIVAAVNDLIETKAWSTRAGHYYGILFPDGTAGGSGDLWLLRFEAVRDPLRIRAALRYVESPQYLQRLGVEEESYLPRIFFINGERTAAYERLLALSDPAKKRREYPEVSFAVIDAFVTGVMGVESQPFPEGSGALIRTVSRLAKDTERASLQGIRIRGATVDVTHVGERQTSFTNHSNRPLRWQAGFTGAYRGLYAEGHRVRASVEAHPASGPMSSIILEVPPGTSRTVTIAAH